MRRAICCLSDMGMTGRLGVWWAVVTSSAHPTIVFMWLPTPLVPLFFWQPMFSELLLSVRPWCSEGSLPLNSLSAGKIKSKITITVNKRLHSMCNLARSSSSPQAWLVQKLSPFSSPLTLWKNKENIRNTDWGKYSPKALHY